MPSKMLQEVADYCWSKNFLDVFRNFFAEHAAVFEDAPPMTDGEHNLKYYSLFQVYLKLYESTLESYLKTLDVSIENFYREVRDAQDETVDPYLQTFIDCLLASADYDSFYKVMSREGERSLTRKVSGMKRNPAAIVPVDVPDAKAESKTSTSNRYEAKCKDSEPDMDSRSDAKAYNDNASSGYK